MKKLSITAVLLLGLTLAGCGDDDNGSSTATVEVAFTGLPALGSGYVYEGWLITGDGAVSAGRFTDPMGYSVEVDTAVLDDSSAYVLTIEPAQGDVRQARAEQRRRVILLEDECLLGETVRFLWPPDGQQPQCCEHVREGRERIGLPGPLEERRGFVGLLVQTEAHPQQAQGRDVRRLELDRSTNGGLQGLPSSFDEGHEGLAMEAVR